MKQGQQKAKGSAYERVIADLLTKAYYQEGDGNFRRVPLSGGFDPRLVPGDLMALKRVSNDTDEMIIDQSWPFSVECKNWRTVSHFFKGLYANESEMFDWMDQATRDASHAKKMPLVVFKLYRQEHLAILLFKDWCQLGMTFGAYSCKRYEVMRFVREAYLGEDDVNVKLVFMKFVELLEWVDWEVYKFSGKAKFIRSIIKKHDQS